MEEAIHGSGSVAFDAVTVVILLGATVSAVLALVRPEVSWRWQMRMARWQFKDRKSPEPSAAVLVFARVIGAATLVAVALLVWLTFFR
ncbi:hypothetical protein [Amycolatopsis bartoniae]|uniref:hypothetical protein n=1 Tax=Amycolatopsis bartoniae TaxID=941986 RepID=UPI0011AB6973|nr:hypothetical protein [Amycolatopsis bartoniae]